jgi:3alpha(or 20beta)-hydroxysteroid dehydrogenase
VFLPLDVTDRDAWVSGVDAVESAFGPLNVLVNNAGIGASTYVETFERADYERVMAINQYWTLAGMQVALPSLRRAGGGSIVNVSSLQGVEADVGLMA